jgi:hypothetical protein
VRNTATGWTTNRWERTVLSSNEEEADLDLKLLDKIDVYEERCGNGDEALETVRKFADKGMLR